MSMFDRDIYDAHSLQKSRKKQKNNTIRNYPQRDKHANKRTYSIKVFKDQTDFDRSYNLHFNRNNQSKKVGYFIHPDFTGSDPLFKKINYIKNFAQDVYQKKIEGFQLKHIEKFNKLYMFPQYENGVDMSYQELADFLNCKVIVNKNLNIEFDVPIGHTDDEKYRGSGFGRVDIKNYSQRGFSNRVQREDPNNLSYYTPNMNTDNASDKINEYVLMIFPPIKKDNYQFSTQMKTAYPRNDVCKCCWYSNGRIWMLKGSGFKSLGKNKGMKKNKRAYLKDIA